MVEKQSIEDWAVVDQEDQFGSKIKYPSLSQVGKKKITQTNLKLKTFPIMDNRNVQIISQDISKDWYVSETITYVILSHKDDKENYASYEVKRRYSDFIWLFEELKFKYPGYLIPQPPEKSPFHKIDLSLTKVEAFEKQKQFFLNNRKKSLVIFLQKLLQHSELKYTPELHSFLTAKTDEFNLDRETSERFRNEVLNKQGMFTNLLNNITGSLSNAFNYFTGIKNQRIRQKDQNDVDFDEFQAYYQRQRNRVNELYLVISTISKCKSQQADNLHKFAQKIGQYHDKNDSFLNQLSLIADQASIQQEGDCQNLIESVEIQLKEHVRHLDSVLEIIQERTNLAEATFQNVCLIEQYQGDVDKEQDLQQLKKKVEEQKKRMELFINYFKFDRKEFNEVINSDLNRLLKIYSQLQQENADEMMKKWKIPINA